MPFCTLCEKDEPVYTRYSKRPFAGCPNCKSLERHRVMAVYLKKQMLTSKKILHIAPEKCLYTYLSNLTNEYVCGDLYPEKYKTMNAIYLDATNMPYVCQFDYIIASHILEHIPDDNLTLTHIYKSLVNGGKCLVMIPQRLNKDITDEDPTVISDEERIIRFGQADHVRYYGLDFSKRLKKAGFHVKIHYIGGIEDIVNKMDFDEKEEILKNEYINKSNLLHQDILYECIKL